MCGSCYDLLPAAPTKVCPLARCDYDRPPRHNLLAERQIAGGGLLLDCDNANHGCLFKGVVQELEEHLVECFFRTVPCPETDCRDRVRLSELDRHIATSPHHLSSGTGNWHFIIEEDMGGLRRADWPRRTQMVDGVTFYNQLVVRDGGWFAFVKVMGGAREAARWSCGVSVKGIATMACTTGLQVHSVDRTLEEILESGQYLALTKQQIKSIAKPLGSGNFQLRVKCYIAEKEDDMSEEESEEDEESEEEKESEEEEENEEGEESEEDMEA